ncbi:MAG: 16S rRNA (cytosine(1402)-N(4))-methyltransferase RsmH [Vulcanimicrobiaceae bacterium]
METDGSPSFLSPDAPQHVAVLLDEAVEALRVEPGGLYVDATFGAGGHTRAIAKRGGRVLAFDVDPGVRVPDDLGSSLELVRRSFAELGSALDERGVERVEGVLFDLGVSSMQFDRGERGFSLQHDGPLDMRLNSAEGTTAYDLLARASESELADLIFDYGEERAARRIARAIVATRAAGRLPTRTLELAKLVAGVVHVRGRRERIHPATRTFQALRLAVNDELGALRRGLDAAAERTRPGGRVVAISFHSLEDRIVKQKFRDDPRLHALTKKPVIAGEAELERNPRARSAKLRVAEREA